MSENKNKYKTVYMFNRGPTIVQLQDGQQYHVTLNKVRVDNQTSLCQEGYLSVTEPTSKLRSIVITHPVGTGEPFGLEGVLQ